MLANLVAIYNVTKFKENCLLKCITKTGSIKDNKFRKRNKNQRKGNFQLLSLLGNYTCISFTVKLMMLSLNVDFCGCSKTFCNAFVKSVYFKISSCQYIYIYIYIYIQLDVHRRSQDSALLAVKERNRPVGELLKS